MANSSEQYVLPEARRQIAEAHQLDARRYGDVAVIDVESPGVDGSTRYFNDSLTQEGLAALPDKTTTVTPQDDTAPVRTMTVEFDTKYGTRREAIPLPPRKRRVRAAIYSGMVALAAAAGAVDIASESTGEVVAMGIGAVLAFGGGVVVSKVARLVIDSSVTKMFAGERIAASKATPEDGAVGIPQNSHRIDFAHGALARNVVERYTDISRWVASEHNRFGFGTTCSILPALEDGKHITRAHVSPAQLVEDLLRTDPDPTGLWRSDGFRERVATLAAVTAQLADAIKHHAHQSEIAKLTGITGPEDVTTELVMGLDRLIVARCVDVVEAARDWR